MSRRVCACGSPKDFYADRCRRCRYPAGPVSKPCSECGAAMICKPSHAPKAFYCSMACMSAAYRHRLRGAANPNYRAAGLRVCEHCGAGFRNYNKARRFCSHRCYTQSDAFVALQAAQDGEMAGRRFGRRDKNHASIVAAFEALGCSVLDLAAHGQGVPDIVVGEHGRTHLVEIKNPTGSYGRRGLNPTQRAWAERWRGGPVAVVRTVDDVLELLRVWRS